VRIDAESGEVVGWLDLNGVEDEGEYKNWEKGDVLNGVSVFDNMVFVTGKNWRHVYRVLPTHFSYQAHIPLP
jgi:glutamine cyclotransferase